MQTNGHAKQDNPTTCDQLKKCLTQITESCLSAKVVQYAFF